MNKITLLLSVSLFSTHALSKDIDCGVVAEVAKSISIEEFYFGNNLSVVNIPSGPIISIWAIDEENRIIENGLSTEYLLRIGSGDIDEIPKVFRVRSKENIVLPDNPRDSITLNDGYMKINLVKRGTDLRCNALIFKYF